MLQTDRHLRNGSIAVAAILLIALLVGCALFLRSSEGTDINQDPAWILAEAKAKMQNLAMAISNLRNDIGCFPSADGQQTVQSFNSSPLSFLGITSATNVLADPSPLPKGLQTQWKGPYIEGQPEEFMSDPWKKTIRYVASGTRVYLWSGGPDGIFDPACDVTDTASYTGDDLVRSVGKF